MKNTTCIRLTAALLALLPAAAAADVTVYSSRQEHLIEPVFNDFTKATGIKVKFLTDSEAPLIRRIKSEGKNTAADLLLTVDAGNLWFAAQEGILEPVSSQVLEKNIPSHLRAPDNTWFGLSVRARTIVYSTKRVKENDLSTYEDLADKKWRGRLCLRTSKKVYNQSLVAMLIAEHGEKKAEAIVSGWVKNLAAPVFANDTKLIEAVVAGTCDVGIVNTYYFGRLQKQDPAIPAALFWPNQETSGVHVNISGGGVVKNAKNKADAQKLLEWLSGEAAQKVFADANFEYPVSAAVEPDPLVKKWGTFKPNLINVSKAGELQQAAVKLMDRVNYK